MAISSFANKGTKDIAFSEDTKLARRILPSALHRIAVMRLAVLDAARLLNDLAMYPGFKLEKLTGDRSGQYCIRINAKYRICFYWKDAHAFEVEIVDYH